MFSPNVKIQGKTLVPDFHFAKRAPKYTLPQGKDDISKAIRCFLTGGIGKFGNYVATQNALVYRTLSKTRSDYEMLQDVIALRITKPYEVFYLGNSSVLPSIGRTVSFGNERLNRGVTEVQTVLSRIIPMLPFTVFTESGLDLTNVQITQRGPEEQVTRSILNPKADKKGQPKMIDETVHFTGASLFEVEGRMFLFDLDRREVEHKIFNPFLVQLNNAVETIAEAYQSLKPKEVVDAEASGLKVLRQGEWFFIPLKGKFQAVTERADEAWDALEKGYRPAELRAGPNRPNRVSRFAGKLGDGRRNSIERVDAVSGFVEHTGREHARLDLKGWYKPVPNTSIQSFTITGDVD